MEREKKTLEEKEEEEEDDKEIHHHIIMASSVENLPIMQWEDLSKVITELEEQDKERREWLKKGTGVNTRDSQLTDWTDVLDEDEKNSSRCRLSIFSSRFSDRNLQMCFINTSDSEEEEEEEDEGTRKQVTMGTSSHRVGLKQEVVTALRTLRDKLLAEQKEKTSSCGSQRKHLERWDLEDLSMQQLIHLRASCQQDVHALSSELVTKLLIRDQLRTKQDAMLLDVQDLT